MWPERTFGTVQVVAVVGVVVAAGMAAAGCAARHEATASSQAALGCPEDLCGRTKVMSRVVGEANPDGMSMTNVVGPHGVLGLQIEDDRFVGVTSSGRRIDDEAMEESLILLERDFDHARFYLRIDQYEQVPDWVTGAPVTAYRLVYQRIDLDDGRGERPLCGKPESSGWEGLAGLSFVFGDDHFIEASRTLTVAANQWFNLACAGDDRAAMHLYRHDQVGAKLGFQTSVAERQAVYKMLGADYCGTGQTFTKEGIPSASSMTAAFSRRWIRPRPRSRSSPSGTTRAPPA